MKADFKYFHPSYLTSPQIQRWVRLLVAFSLANLCYLRVWDLLFQSEVRQYFSAVRWGAYDYLGALYGLALFTALFYVFFGTMWKSANRWLRASAMFAMVGVFLLPIDFISRSSENLVIRYAGFTRLQVIAACGLILIGAGVIFRQRFYALTYWVIAILSPYAFINIAHLGVKIGASGAPIVGVESAAKEVGLPGGASARVVWIVFDEWDQAATFERRPPGLKLPAIDSFVANSISVTNAYPPAGNTLISLPSLLTGKRLSAVKVKNADDLQIKEAGSEIWQDFRAVNNVFVESLSKGKRIAVYGWYHPYHRLLPQGPGSDVRSWGFSPLRDEHGGVVAAALSQIKFLTSATYGRHLLGERYQEMHQIALAAIRDPKIDLIFLHYGIPHLPGIYNADKKLISSDVRIGSDAYFDNLSLVDRTIDDLTNAVVSAGLSNNTVFILSADHWWRSSPWSSRSPDYRVPLLIRAAGNSTKLNIDKPICTVAIRELVARILDGSTTSSLQFAEWLRGDHGSVPRSYSSAVAEWPPAGPMGEVAPDR